MAVFTTLLFPVVNGLFGKKGIKALQLIMYQMGIDRAPIVNKALNIDVNDARSLGRILDFDDGLCEVKGVWTMETKGKAIKVVGTCPLGRMLVRCPEICRTIIAAMEAGTFYPLNPNIKVPELPRLISEGGDCCVGTIELPYLEEHTALEISPWATGPDNYAPAIHIPGLNKKLACQAFKTLGTSSIKLLRYGTKQKMAWYDFFKYQSVKAPQE
ncbi:MAG TPA: hypothetical protein EYP19_02200 [Desulfobacterales bacterium]|nr:hypothetical protein [Desulfobacterales bacterium]